MLLTRFIQTSVRQNSYRTKLTNTISGPNTKNAIITAMRYWQSQTCVKFRPRRKEKVGITNNRSKFFYFLIYLSPKLDCISAPMTHNSIPFRV